MQVYVCVGDVFSTEIRACVLQESVRFIEAVHLSSFMAPIHAEH